MSKLQINDCKQCELKNGIIEGLRDELNIAKDGIDDLNDVVKDLQAEINDILDLRKKEV